MDEYQKSDSPAVGAVPEEIRSEAGSGTSTESGDALAIERLREYQKDCLDIENNERALLRHINGGAIGVLLRLEDKLIRLMDTKGDTIFEDPHFQQLMKNYTGLLKQVFHYVEVATGMAQLELQVKDLKLKRRTARTERPVPTTKPK